VSALPPAYFVQQLRDFRSGLRRSADPRKPNTNTMADLARAMTDEEMTQAAEYFGAIKWKKLALSLLERECMPTTG
jgi:cytochrome c553